MYLKIIKKIINQNSSWTCSSFCLDVPHPGVVWKAVPVHELFVMSYAAEVNTSRPACAEAILVSYLLGTDLWSRHDVLTNSGIL